MAQYSRRYSVVMSKWHFTWCWNAFITLVALHNSKLPECIYTEGHIAFIPGWFALKRMYMSDCTFAMSDCISQMLETHFGKQITVVFWRILEVYRLPFFKICSRWYKLLCWYLHCLPRWWRWRSFMVDKMIASRSPHVIFRFSFANFDVISIEFLCSILK